MAIKNIIPSNYCDVKGFLESNNIKISDIIKEMMDNGKDYPRWFKNLLHEDMYENWFAKYFSNILEETSQRRDYRHQCEQELSKYGIVRSPFEFKQDVEVSSLFEDWIKLKLEKCGMSSLDTNNKATKSEESQCATTAEDYVYTSESGEEIPVELKTRYMRKDWGVVFRDGAGTVKNNGSLVLVYYPYRKKMAVVDFSDPDVVSSIKPNNAFGKNGEKVDLDENQFFDFNVCSNNISILKSKIEEVLARR